MRGWRGSRTPGQRGVLHRALALPVLAAVLAGCGGSPGAPAPAPPGPPAPDSPADPPAPDGSADPTGVLPPPYCEGGPLDCRMYRSTGGRDSSGELGWLKEQPLEVSSVFANGTWTIGVKTPCNELGVEVDVGPGQLVPGQTIGTAMACLGPESGYEEWVRELFRQTVRWERNGRSLVFSNAHGTVEFEDAGPSAP